jgi:hypothetical protein
MITQIGVHRVQCGNLMDGIDKLMDGQIADLVYSDPPWGEGNLKYWETIRQRHTGDKVRRENPLGPFLDKFFEVSAKYSKNVVIVLYGIQWESQVLEVASKHGLTRRHLCTPKYRAGSALLPVHLHVFSKTPIVIPEGYSEAVESRVGYASIEQRILPFLKSGQLLVDPCTGEGSTSQFAIDHDAVLYGNELNEKRLSKTIAKLTALKKTKRK